MTKKNDRDILQELKDRTYKPSISRLKKLLDKPIEFLDTSFTGNYYTRMGTAHEHYLTFDKLPSNFAVVKGEEPAALDNDLMWSLVDSLSLLMLEGGEFEESFAEAVEMSDYKQTETQVRKYFQSYKKWFLNMIEHKFEGKECITEDVFEIVKNMSSQYKKEEALLPFLKGDLQFRCEFKTHGWTCKGFLDRYNEEDGIVVDFKTTKSKPLIVPRKQRYDLQGAYYKDGVSNMGFPVNGVLFIISQTVPPYKPYPIWITNKDLEVGTNGGLFPALEKVKVFKNTYYELVNEEVKGYTQLLDQLTWHVENGFDKKQPDNLFKNSNLWT